MKPFNPRKMPTSTLIACLQPEMAIEILFDKEDRDTMMMLGPLAPRPLQDLLKARGQAIVDEIDRRFPVPADPVPEVKS